MISLQIENLGALKRFSDKLGKLYATDLSSAVAGELAKAGAQYAQQLYTGSATAVAEISGNGEATVTATGHGLLYREYGTGYVGEGTYEGNLPQRPFNFSSRGETFSLTEWTYHYWDKLHEKQALGGWYFNGKFTRGEPAQAQMWKTYLYLRENKAQIVQDFLRAVNK